jgi:hypothetical protein
VEIMASFCVRLRASGNCSRWRRIALMMLAPVALAAAHAATPATGVSALSVGLGAPVISATERITLMRGFPFTHAIRATNSPTKFQAHGLPRGLTCDSATGLITGVTGDLGEFTVTLEAENDAGRTAATVVFVADGMTPIEMPLVRNASLPASGTFRPGDTVTVEVEIDAPYGGLIVTGSPRVALRVGTEMRHATFTSSTGAGDRPRLEFRYLVAPGDQTESGVAIGPAIELNGGSIRDRVGLHCALGLPDLFAPNVRVVGRGTPHVPHPEMMPRLRALLALLLAVPSRAAVQDLDYR